MSNIKLLKESSIRKGGHNELPTRPRPKTPPKGQGGGMSKYLEFKIREEKAKTGVLDLSCGLAGGDNMLFSLKMKLYLM